MKNDNSKNVLKARRAMTIFGLIVIGFAAAFVITSSSRMQTRLPIEAKISSQSPETNLTLGKLAFQHTLHFVSGAVFSDIVSINSDGTGQATLSNNGITPQNLEPAWSPDGAKIAFGASGFIAVINTDGSNFTYITGGFGGDTSPSWSVNNKIAFRRTNQIWTMNADGSNQTQFSAITQPSPLAPAWSPDGAKLAFASGGEIWVINADGTGERRVTNDSAADADPAWSPDGTKIIYGKNGSGIVVINLDGTNETNLTNGSNDGQPAWSSDNTKIAFVRKGVYSDNIDGIYLINPNGSNLFRFIADYHSIINPDFDENLNPAWQPTVTPPDTFNISGHITRVGANLSGVTVTLSGSASASATTDFFGNYRFDNLPTGGGFTVTPSLNNNIFSPQSRAFNNLTANQIADFTASETCSTPNCETNGKIVFVKNNDIYTMSTDGLNQVNITNTSAIENEPSYSPDGSKIIFDSNRDGNYEIYTMNTDGSGVIRLTNNSANDNYPSYSSDGKKIVFVSFRDGNNEIYTMNADGTNQVRLTNNQVPDYAPKFSPDGSKIVYSGGVAYSPTFNFFYIFTMNADGTNPVQLTHSTTEPFDRTPSYSPDGTKIIFDHYRGTGCSECGAISVMNADGSNQFILRDSAYNNKPTYSPDGKKILFSFLNSSTITIDTMNSDGSGVITLAVGDLPNWQPLSPTAANAAIAGKVVNRFGRGIAFVRMSLLNTQTGGVKIVLTNSFGYFTFVDLPVGSLYLVTANSKRCNFEQNTQAIKLFEDFTDLTFVEKEP